MLGLYLHIPFCSSICNYCNFNRGLFEPGLKDRYVAALDREIRQTGRREPVDTIFFGGGTPSLLEPDEVGRLVESCRQVFDVTPDAEVTLETNPETSSTGRMEGFRSAGVNRVSFGVQSFRGEELARLGRLHSATRALEAVDEARAAGITNISLDLDDVAAPAVLCGMARERRGARWRWAGARVAVPAGAVPERTAEGDDGAGWLVVGSG